MIFVSGPSPTNSVHRPIPYVFDFQGRDLDSVADDGGFANITIGGLFGFSPTPSVGERFYIDSGVYEGYHTISVVNSTSSFTLETAYISNQTSGTVKYLRIPEIQLWSGYNAGETYETELPLTLIASFTPVISPEVDIRFDVSGFLKSIFTIQAPTIGVDFSLFNRFRLNWDDAFSDDYQVVNSAIETQILNDVYFGTGVYLNSGTPILFGCGKTILSTLDGSGVVINTEIEDAEIEADYFYDDYDESDYFTQNS